MKKVLLLLAEGFEAYEASVFTDVIGWNLTEGDGSTQIVSCGIHSQISCTWGFKVIPDILLSEVNPDDYAALAIPGGFEEAGFYADGYSEDFLQVIRAFDTAGKPIASVCVAALPVARSGVLTGRNATTYHLGEGRRRRQLAELGANVIDAPIVIDRNIITSSNPATALSVAFQLLQTLTTPENTRNVKYLMGF